jgi:hypothetical protein
MFFPDQSPVEDAGRSPKRPLLQIDRAEAQQSDRPTPEAGPKDPD